MPSQGFDKDMLRAKEKKKNIRSATLDLVKSFKSWYWLYLVGVFFWPLVTGEVTTAPFVLLELKLSLPPLTKILRSFSLITSESSKRE